MTTTFDFIANVTLNSPSSTVTVNNIPSIYTDLRIQWSQVSGNYPLLSFNGDTGSNYYTTGLRGASTNYGTPGVGWSPSTPYLYANGGGDANATNQSIYIFDVFNYNDNIFKTVLITGANDFLINGVKVIERWGGNWNSTSAITSITINRAAVTDFAAGSNLQIYGIKRK